MVLNKTPFLPSSLVMRGGFMVSASKAISYHIANRPSAKLCVNPAALRPSSSAPGVRRFGCFAMFFHASPCVHGPPSHLVNLAWLDAAALGGRDASAD